MPNTQTHAQTHAHTDTHIQTDTHTHTDRYTHAHTPHTKPITAVFMVTLIQPNGDACASHRYS